MFATDFVRYAGEPVAAVAADHPETCRRALAAIVVDYEVLEPLTDPEEAIAGTREPIHPDGNVFRHQRIRARRPGRRPGRSSSRAPTRSACRTRRSSAPRPRSPCPTTTAAGSSSTSRPSGCTRTASRSPPASACPRTRCAWSSAASAARSAPARTSACRCTAACWRCAPAGRSRCSTAARRASTATCTATRRRSGCATTPTADGTIVKVEARMVFDGGAYASTSPAVLINGVTPRAGPVPLRRTPSSTAGRCARTTRRAVRCAGFGVVQACFAHEGQMDKLAAARRHRPGRAAAAQRHAHRRPADHRAAGRQRRAGRALHPRDRRAADAARPARPTPTRCRCRAAPGAPPTAGTSCAGVGFGVVDQEPDVLRGLRRLRRPRAAGSTTASPR